MISTSPQYKPKFGDIRADGFIFHSVNSTGTESWLSPSARTRQRFNNVRVHAQKRATTGDVPFDITTSYIESIYPEDGKCPVFGFVMEFGGGYSDRDTSPSLDRILPELGYVPGNLRWISNRANTLKRDANLAELEAVVLYMKTLQ